MHARDARSPGDRAVWTPTTYRHGMKTLDQDLRDRIAVVRVARLASIRPDGTPHVVPITFAVDASGGGLVTAVDHKPKSTTELQRLANIEANPAVAVLIDHYQDDWSRLWWARADGTARVHRDGHEREKAVDRLVDKYGQYRPRRPAGPAIIVVIERWSSWSA